MILTRHVRKITVVEVVVDEVEVEEVCVVLLVVEEAEVVVPEVEVGDSVVVTTSLELPYVKDFNNVAPAPIKRALLITILALLFGLV